MTDITYDEITAIEESVCDGCRAYLLGCTIRCEAFWEELKEMRENDST